MCPPPFDRPEGLQPEAQATLAAALDTLYQHMVAGPSNPILNQTEIILATNDVIANSHQLTASYELMAAALSLVEAYEGFDGSGPPTSYGPPVLKSQQFSRVQGTLDDREVDRTMMMIQQAILDQMFHASLWGIDGVPTEKTSEMVSDEIYLLCCYDFFLIFHYISNKHDSAGCRFRWTGPTNQL